MSNEGDNDGWAEVQAATRCTRLDGDEWMAECVRTFGHTGGCSPRHFGSGPLRECVWLDPYERKCGALTGRSHFGDPLCDKHLPAAQPVPPRVPPVSLDNWCNKIIDQAQRDAQTRFTNVPAGAAHYYGVQPRTAFPNLYTKTGSVLQTAYDKGVSFPTGDSIDVKRDAKLVEEILTLDEENRKKHPDQYPKEPGLAAALQRERDLQARASAAEGRISIERARAEKAEACVRFNLDQRDRAEKKFAEMNRQIEAMKETGREARATVKVLGERLAETSKERDSARGELDASEAHGSHYYQKWCEVDEEARQLRAAPARTARRLSGITFLGLLAILLTALLTGCAATSVCGGKIGEHCGCVTKGCVEPCSVCCKTVPCPVVGCAQ